MGILSRDCQLGGCLEEQSTSHWTCITRMKAGSCPLIRWMSYASKKRSRMMERGWKGGGGGHARAVGLAGHPLRFAEATSMVGCVRFG